MKRFAIYNEQGKQDNRFPTYGDLTTACVALDRFRDRHPNDGLYLDEINQGGEKMKQAPFFSTMKALADDFFAEADKFIEQQKAKQNDIH